MSFPADILGANAPEFANLGIDLVMADVDTAEQMRLRLVLSRRLLGTNHFELWGSDTAGAFVVHLSGRPDGPWRLEAHVAAEVLDGHQMRDVLHVLRAFSTARKVGLAAAGEVPHSWGELPQPALAEPIPDGLADVVEAHAYIEQALSCRVPAPATYTADDVQNTLATAALLRGETVAQPWTILSWPMPTQEAERVLADLFSDDGQARMELEQEWSWTVGSLHTVVGAVALVYGSVRVAHSAPDPAEPGTTVLTLQPGTHEQLHVRLTRVADATAGEPLPDQRWFWTPAWQAREREVDEHAAAGRISVHSDARALFSGLQGRVDRPGE